ncbi:endonuclease/exonuclease/phosphatase family protein [Nonomuraea sp. MCN248]|uniref:Endonuclease/exonuclease/phosphatase family protein n=1 Tax=Nonomuraea corallina TaxID=2989783 RepID=A0ABT4SLT6_9ACTN|nr:endonuclease/exonuclease/phosphatase family protein [Nonomuraea corallina]MDA0638074.1 endonuclease/exonuclease/phosphatase family protein [Nonomuraea corallina]
MLPLRHQVALLVLGVVLFLDVLRVFLPSLITLFGRAGSTAPELMGLYAAAWFVLPFLALPLRPRWAVLGGAAALVLARVLLQAEVSQLYVASAGVSAGLVFLYGCARSTTRTATPAGIMGGLACSILGHLLLDGVDLVWRSGPLVWAAVLTLCAAFLALTVHPPRRPPAPGDPQGRDELAPAGTWFLFGPVLLLTGMAATGYAKAAVGPSLLAWDAFFQVAALVAATVLASRPSRSSAFDTIAGALLVCFTGLLLLPSSGSTGLGLSGAMVLLWAGPVLAASAQRRAGGRQGVAVLGGGVVFLVATFAYYASYDLDLGVPNQVWPIAIAVLAAVVALRPGQARPLGPRVRRRVWPPVAATAALAALVAVTSWQPLPVQRAAAGTTVKLVVYNIRMGFGLDGRLSLDDIAAWIAAQEPDVVLLSEVDRGWLLNGGHDDLARIARGLGMRYHFAPAADNVWGDALLTDLSVRAVHSHPLGRHDYPTGAQAQAIVLGVEGGGELGIVNTHLQAPDGQAAEVAAMVRALVAGKDAAEATPAGQHPRTGVVRPVVLAGDLNIRPADPEMRVLEQAGLSDPLLDLGDPPTSPADAPAERIDHVLITEGLTALSAEAPRVPFSDHLPVVATLRLTSVDQQG